jgi:putative flippase GtrA
VASLAATAVDGGVYQACLAASTSPSAHYASAAALGACFGAVTNFSINRWWTFRAQRTPLFTQALRYTLGSALTLVVLQGLLWLLVERASVTAGLAWLPAKLVTWAVFSYPFQRLLVFAGVRS